MSKILEGKVAVVSGSGQGIGRAIAIAFAEQGAKVITNNRKAGSTGSTMITEDQVKKLSGDKQEWFKKGIEDVGGDAETTAQTIRDAGGEATPVFCDISKIKDAEHLIQTTIDTYGRIDILCNVAGAFGFAAIEDITPELWDLVNNVKPRGYFYTMKYAVPHMRKQKYGRIILCASPAITGGPVKYAEYVTANAAVVGLTRAAAWELSADGITVNCFAPGALTRASYDLEALKLTSDSPIFVGERSTSRPSRNEVEVTPGPEHVAPFVSYLASDKSSGVNGSVFLVMGNRIGLYTEQTIGKTIDKDSKEIWEINELVEKIETNLLSEYKSSIG